MLPSAVIFLFAVVGVTRSNAAVTNDDIRAAILQLVKVVKVVEDKLERHEYRDRVIGEQLKKGLINIDKRIKMLDPLKGTVSRLDERLAAVETILMQKNEREKMQLQRTYEAVIDIQKNLPVIIEDMKNDIISKIVMPEPPAQITEAVMTKKDFEKMEKEVATKMDKITNGVDKLGNELSKLQDANKNIKDLHNKSSDNLEKLKQHINDSQQVLTKYDKKLSEFSNKGTAPNHKEQEELKKNVLKVLDSQKSSVKDILQDIKNLHNQVKQLPQKGDVTNLQHTVTNKCNGSGDGALKQTLNKIIDNLNKSHNDAMKNINGLTELTATLMKSFANTNNVLDTQNSNVKEILRDVKYLQQHMNGSSSNSQAPITGDIQRDLNKIIENINSTHDDAMKNINGLTELTATMMKSFAYTNSDVKYILQDVQNLKQQINHLPHSDNVTNAQGTILNKLEHILNSSKSGLDTLNRIDENVNNGHQDTVKNINGLSEITATLLKSSANINNAIDAQKSEVEEILRGVTNIRNKIDQLPQRDDLLKAQQKTDRKVEETCTPNNNNNLSNDAGLSLEEIKNSLIRNDRDITRNLQNLTDLMKNTCGSSSKTSDAKEILNDLKYLQNQVNQLPQKHNIAENLNTTLQKLGQLSNEISYRSEKSVEDIRKTLRHINDNINKTHEDTAEKLNDLSEISVTLGESFVSNYDKIKAEIQGLNRLDQVLIKTADNVIDMKRRLEFGVLQIMSESNKNSKETVKNIQDALSDRLDSFEESILDDKNGALANVTSKLEEDIQQVWRQIGIMYQQMSSNSEVLKQLQNQTDAYVNGSIGAMNNVKGKVGQITGRITEVDENLNYLLGRLSLVTQEFGRIKTGLSSALDQIRQSFNAVQNKINEGPGPHNITSSEETVPAS